MTVQCFVPIQGMTYLADGAAAGYVKWEDYAAVVQERDKYFMDMVEANHEATQLAQALRAEVKPADAGEEGWLVRWPGEALRTFWTKNPQGFTHYDSEVVRVRVVRVEEGTP